MAVPSNLRSHIRFGLFELDLDDQVLRKGSVVCRLQRQPFKVLALLVTSAGHIVTREQLRHELWGEETFVDFEQGLNYCIRQIRAILGDDAQHPQYIETVPRRGYRFVAAIDNAELLKELAEKNFEHRLPWYHRRWTVAVFLLGAAILVAGIILGIRSFRTPPLTQKDYLLVTEFSNQTGDSIFDATLRKAVSIDLGQSPYLNIVADDRIRQTLTLMGKAPGTRISPEIGQEICRRNGFKAMLTGTLASLGSQYSVALEVVNANSGELLAEEREQAASKEQVLAVLGKANTRLRKKLGESLNSIQQFDKPLEQATTPSLEALQLYTMGLEKRSISDLDSVPFFERAIQLDPDFALAHAMLGTVYLNVEQLQLAEEHEKKAVALSDRVSEREKLYITAHYYLLVGQRDKVIQTYETYSRLYPRDALPEGNLANEYVILGRFDKGLEHALAGLRLAPDSAEIHAEAATSYEGLGRLEEAKAVVLEGLKKSPDSSWLNTELSNIALAQGDVATRNRADAVLKATPAGNLDLLYRDASLAASRGRLRESEDLYSQASQLALKLGLKENASFAMALRAVYEAYLQKPSPARDSANAALKLSKMSDTIPPAAIALALSGRSKDAEDLIEDLAKRRPEDTAIQFEWAPVIHAIASLDHGDAENAIRVLALGVPYDRGNVDVMRVRAIAFLQAKRPADAVQEFRRIMSLRMRFPADPACTLAQLGLARALALAGDKSSSRAAYEEFLTLWKDADSDLPVLQQAKTEYANLQ